MYPIEKYRFYTNGYNKVIAASTYAGKVVRGVAKLSDGDSFDIEKGKKLAAARCEVKVAEKRLARAAAKREQADDLLYAAECHYGNMLEYEEDSRADLNDARSNLEELLGTL